MRGPLRLLALAGVLFAVLSAVPALAATLDGEAVRGRIEQRLGEAEQPVGGVVIRVNAAGGAEVGSVTTDDQGQWQLPLPRPGAYTATLDPATLPEGAQLRDPRRATLSFQIRPGQQRTLLFPLGEGGGGQVSTLSRALQLTVEGVKFGLIIAITAIGLSLIFGTTGLVNFAHGELVTFGALAAWLFNASALGPELQLIPATLLAVVVGGGAGAALDLGLFRPLRERRTGLIALIVVSIGLSLLLRHAYLFVFGGRTRPYTDYAVQRALQLGPVAVAPKDLVVMALSVVVLVGVAVLLFRTRIGKAMRAVADNRDLAESSGIDVQRVILTVWALGGALAALGGVFQGLGEQVSFQMGFQLLLLMFAGVVLGGLGTAFGPLLGSLVVGILVQVSTLYIPTEIKYVPALVLLILILLVRPQGILGRAERVG